MSALHFIMKIYVSKLVRVWPKRIKHTTASFLLILFSNVFLSHCHIMTIVTFLCIELHEGGIFRQDLCKAFLYLWSPHQALAKRWTSLRQKRSKQPTDISTVTRIFYLLEHPLISVIDLHLLILCLLLGLQGVHHIILCFEISWGP